jgi:glycosyltransferase involved in cell wall biosynthesis
MLAQFYAPVVGGEERAVEDLGVALTRRGHEVAVATLGQDGLPPREVRDGVRVHRLRGSFQRLHGLFSEAGRRHVPPIPDPELVRSLGRVLRTERPDVIHAHNWLVHSMTPLKPVSAAPLVLSLHDYSLVCATKRFFYKGGVCSGPGAGKCLNHSLSYYGAAKGLVAAAGVAADRHGARLPSQASVSSPSAAGTEAMAYAGPMY